MRQRPKLFLLTWTLAIVVREDEIWPDGDGPEAPNAKDVEERLDHGTNIPETLREFDLVTARDRIRVTEV